MIKRKINPLIKETAKTLNYPEAVVNHLVMYSFAHLKEEMTTESRYPKIRLFHLGSFEVNRNALRTEIQHTITKIRLSRTPELVSKLNRLLQLRHKVYAYTKSRKFKERFGSWHYKAAGGPDFSSVE